MQYAKTSMDQNLGEGGGGRKAQDGGGCVVVQTTILLCVCDDRNWHIKSVLISSQACNSAEAFIECKVTNWSYNITLISHSASKYPLSNFLGSSPTLE